MSKSQFSRKFAGSEFGFVGSGVECHVHRYSEKLVLKSYRTKGECLRAFRRQKQAARAGVAPPTRGLAKHGYRFAYFSYAAVCDDNVARKDRVRGNAYRKLAKAIKALGLSAVDLHEGNVGHYLGKAVCIDFGDQSVSNNSAYFNF